MLDNELFNGKTLAASRQEAHQWLDDFLNLLERDEAVTSDRARHYLMHLSMLIADIAGKRLAERAFPDAFGAHDKGNGLQQLADKIAISGRMLGRLGGGGDAFSIHAAVQEVRAMASGDEAKLFSNRAPGSKDEVNSYRLSTHRLVALQWKEYFLARGGLSASACNGLIAAAYGDDWETIRKWKKPLVHRLGRGVAEALDWARTCGSARRPFKGRIASFADEDALAEDGRMYGLEKGRMTQR